jgi:3'-5' exoribonuclease
MRNQLHLNEIQEGQSFKGFLMLNRIALQKSKNDKVYANIELSDSTGTIEARWWDVDNAIVDSLGDMQPVAVKGEIVKWQDKLQLRLDKIRPVEASDEEYGFDYSLLIPTSPCDPEEMWEEILSIVSEVEDPALKELLSLAFNRYGEEFKVFPAAVRLHHAYRSGLLEHTLAVANTVKHLCLLYPRLNKDLIITGALLHDIGKLSEYRELPRSPITTEGELVGHVVKGWEMVLGICKSIDGFPEDYMLRLGHILLSHHGKYEFGSPKLPKTAEAIAVNYADDLNAKLSLFYQVIDNDRETGKFTAYSSVFEGRLYKGD